MRTTILVGLFLILLAGCVFRHEDAKQSTGQPAAREQVAETTTIPDPPGEVQPEADGEQMEEAEVEYDAEGNAHWKEVELPRNWPEDISLVKDARVIYRERVIHKPSEPNSIIMESQVPVEEAGIFYLDDFTLKGWQRLDMSRGPQFYNVTFLDKHQIVDVNIRHMPEELPGMEGVEAVGDARTDFEGTVIKIQTMPAGDLSYFKNAVAWYSMDDVPPGFPLDEVPRYPGGVINMASFAEGDHVVLQQHCENGDLAKIKEFYCDHFVSEGLEMVINEETDESFSAEFTGEDCFVRLSVARYPETPTAYFDIYKQFTTEE